MTPVSKNKTKLGKKQLLEIYYYLTLNRALDDRVASLYRRGKFRGGAYVSRGQEAISIGSAYALKEGDVVVPLIRNSGVYLVRGITPGLFLANYLGKQISATRGKDGTSHSGDTKLGIFSPISMLGAMIPVCAGFALAFKMRQEKRVAVTWIGDGGASTGDFHEGLNFAAVLKLPLVLFVENNGFAYSTPTRKQTLLKDLVKRAQAYGIPGEIVDGNDVLAVYECTQRALRHARSGKGPVLIEAKTFRMRGHAEHDDAFYVLEKSFKKWQKRDPLNRFESYLLQQSGIRETQLQKIKKRVTAEMDDAEQFADNSRYPAPGEAALDVYAE